MQTNTHATGAQHANAITPLDDDAVAAAYLRGRDAACPMCGYNRRDGTGAGCPECGFALSLTSDAPALRRQLFLLGIMVYIYVLVRGLLLAMGHTVSFVEFYSATRATGALGAGLLISFGLSFAINLGTAIAAGVLLISAIRQKRAEGKPIGGIRGQVWLLGSLCALLILTNVVSVVLRAAGWL